MVFNINNTTKKFYSLPKLEILLVYIVDAKI
jgi:hypothetical protein